MPVPLILTETQSHAQAAGRVTLTITKREYYSYLFLLDPGQRHLDPDNDGELVGLLNSYSSSPQGPSSHSRIYTFPHPSYSPFSLVCTGFQPCPLIALCNRKCLQHLKLPTPPERVGQIIELVRRFLGWLARNDMKSTNSSTCQGRGKFQTE